MYSMNYYRALDWLDNNGSTKRDWEVESALRYFRKTVEARDGYLMNHAEANLVDLIKRKGI